ncbi:hypothetical protein BDN72DRAFT_843288 [Pluteus cervinus]|uniref:Uncharacterized protein n=1 Tax=Pluteus cervinus TaxID=181527 RepID=A0ACD3APS1_9AGAR|nr:hypothetical protein BDN72DRAFT_843288 [Pluteus cervinus]
MLVAESGMDVSYGGSKYNCDRDTNMLALDLNIDRELSSTIGRPTTLSEDATYWLSVAHFRGIQVLQISHIQTDASQTIFSQSAFWIALQDAGCRPMEFSVDFITDTMLDYLTSFSNLQYLCVKDTRTHQGVHDSEELATKFYKKVLRAHRETLQALVVDITLPGPWFLQSSNIEDLFVCQKLEKLAIALSSPKDAISQDLLVRPFLPLIMTL